MLVIDTHILIEAAEGRIRPSEARLLDDFWSISDITLWEIAWLYREERIRMGPDDPRLRSTLDQLTIWPIDFEVARALRLLDFRSDPADEIIAATSIAHDIPLLTRDTRILASKVVPLAL
jgi:PIN domain nuclease of toxin-antitoxin system